MVTQTVAPPAPQAASVRRLLPAAADGYILAAILFPIYAAMSLIQNRAFGTGGFDLGIFDQAVRSYAHFHAPIVELKGVDYDLLGDHFSPALAVLAPLYWIRPRPTTLLVAQAALVAISLLPIHRLALKRLGRAGALALAVAYGLSFGVQTAIAFDFHEVALAAPLFAFGLVALVEQRWRASLAWLLPLLLVREEMGVYLAVIGLILFLRGQRKMGLWLGVGGLLAAVLVVKVIIPHFNPGHANPYLGFYPSTSSLWTAPLHLVDAKEKIKTIVLVAGVTGLLALRSPLMLLTLVNLTSRFLADNPLYWNSFAWAYGLVLMPIAFVGYLDAYPRWQESRVAAVRWYTRWSPAVLLALALALIPRLPMITYLVHAPQHLQLSTRQHTAYKLMAEIPDGARVDATNHLAPHLTNRCDVVQWPFTQEDTPWVIVDTQADDYVSTTEQSHVAQLLGRGYLVVADQDGYLLLREPGKHRG